MCDTEVYTVRVDSVNTTVSNVDFVSYINIPLRNVVKAELVSATIAANINDTHAIYIYIDELVSKFNDRATLEFNMIAAGTISTQGGLTAPVSNLQYLKSALAAIPTYDATAGSRTIYTASGSGFPTDVAFVEPIRQLKTLSVKLFKADGQLVVDQPFSNFLTFRFTCAKPNVCQYGGQIV
jgi:hypothetical protein